MLWGRQILVTQLYYYYRGPRTRTISTFDTVADTTMMVGSAAFGDILVLCGAI